MYKKLYEYVINNIKEFYSCTNWKEAWGLEDRISEVISNTLENEEVTVKIEYKTFLWAKIDNAMVVNGFKCSRACPCFGWHPSKRYR